MGDVDRPSAEPFARPRATTICLLAALFLCSGLIGIVWWTGAVPQRLFGHDMIALLDGGAKWRAGFVPHVDYYSPFGVFLFVLVGAGIDLAGSMVDAIPTATCLLALLALPLAAYAAFTRLHPVVAFAATVLLVATALAPSALRFGSDGWSYAAIYNRWAYPLLGTAVLIMAARPFRASRRGDRVDGAIVGSLVTVLIFFKISFGLLALGLFAGLAPVRPRARDYWAAAAMAGLVWSLLAGWLLRWGYSAMLGDMAIASHARHGLGPEAFLYWARSIRTELLVLAALAAAWCATGIAAGRVPRWRGLVEAGWIAAAFGGSAAAILMTNAPDGYLNESPVIALGALLFLSGIAADAAAIRHRPVRRAAVRPRVALAAASVLAAIAFAPMTARNMGGIAKAAAFKRRGASLPPAQVFAQGPLRGLEIAGFGGDPPLPTSYVGKVMDGVDLLARTGNARRTVTALEFTNPFNLVRGTPPSRTAPVAWQLGFVFSPSSAPSAERVFEPGDAVMIPRQFGDGKQQNLLVLRDLYGAYLDRRYRLAGQSRQWRLYVPR